MLSTGVSLLFVVALLAIAGVFGTKNMSEPFVDRAYVALNRGKRYARYRANGLLRMFTYLEEWGLHKLRKRNFSDRNFS